jgi:DNA repair protein RadA/Sms
VAEHPAGRSLRAEPSALLGARSGPASSPVGGRAATLALDREERRILTGFPGVDRVLGGGLVPGSVVLLAGAPGIGKSTLLLQLASRLSEAGHPCLLASGEEARGQVAARASRLGVKGEAIRFVPGRDLGEVLAIAQTERPKVLIVDSIHTVRDAASDSLPGGTSQVRACADAFVWLAKEEGVTVLLIGHVTKDGDLAGPRTLEHAVDAVLTFEGEPRSGLRLLAGGKNRFGPEGEVAWFEMRGDGLVETEAGPRLGEGPLEAGCATALTLAGRRAFAVDVQALVVPTDGPPRRQVAGLDPRRFHIVAAVTDRVGGYRLMRAELFGAAGGGFRMDDPGADLAVAVALASASRGQAPPPGSAFLGEVSLAGAVRPVSGVEQRLPAALAAGVRTVVLPAGASGGGGSSSRGVRLVRVGHIREALAWAFGRDSVQRPGRAVPGSKGVAP